MRLPSHLGGWVTLALVSIFAAGAVWSLIRARRSHQHHIRPHVEAAGLTLVRVDIPRFWQTGPFPKFGFRRTPLHTRIGPISGEYTVLRKAVVTRDHDRDRAQEREIWCCLRFSAFRLDAIEFRPPLAEFLSNRPAGIA